MAEEMRCAECDCESGGAECNWIAPGSERGVDAFIQALRDSNSEKYRGAREAIAKDYKLKL